MVDRPGCCAHRDHLPDFIPILWSPRFIKNEELARKYLARNVSAQQLADEYGVSKQIVLGRLRLAGVHGAKGRGRSPDNFRFPNPTYGYCVKDGRLETDPREMKIVRLAVELRDRQGCSFVAIANELNRRGHRNRKGTLWHHVSVRNVHKNWSGKV
jgi:hypothetical protein